MQKSTQRVSKMRWFGKMFTKKTIKRTLRKRFTEHRQATRNPLHANTKAAVCFHFNLPDHLITDIELISLELQPIQSTSRRKVQEDYLIDRGKTLI